MRLSNPARILLVLAATALAVGLPIAGSLARSRKPPVVEAPPPPAPPTPASPVGLPDRMIQDAAAYDGYMRRAVSLSPAFTDAASVSQALSTARAYGSHSLVRGAVAYGAIAALQDKTFVVAVRDAGNSPEHRAQMVSYILANPAYVSVFADAAVVAGLAQRALGPSALRLHATGKAVRQAAYDIQRQGWSKAQVIDLPGRLAAAEAAAAQDMPADPERLAEARQLVAGVAPLPISAPPLQGPYTPLVAHALQLAAIAALGEARDDTLDQLSPLTLDEDTSACLGAAKRNFHQCLAVAKPNYEDIFCTGQHALIDTGACMANAAGVSLPPEPPPPPPLVKKRPLRRRHHG